MRRVRVGITVGDPAGIGPEIARKARVDPRVLEAYPPADVTIERIGALVDLAPETLAAATERRTP